jgi:CheY-like chemotaxis protein
MKPKRILVADDCPVLRGFYGLVFAGPGTEVVVVADGAAALRATEARAFDLVVTDHEMPGMDGLAFVRALRAHGYEGPIAVVSGALTPALVAEYGAAGVARVLPKPCSLAALRALAVLAPMRGLAA